MGALCCCAGDVEEHLPPREYKQKRTNRVIGKFVYKQPTSEIETTHNDKPMITVHYGLVAGKWDYTNDEVKPSDLLTPEERKKKKEKLKGKDDYEDLIDVKRNMKAAEYMMKQVGVKKENLVILADPTFKNFQQAIAQLKLAIKEGNEDDRFTQNAQVNFYWGGHSGIDKNTKLAVCIQNAETYPIQKVLEQIGQM